MRRYWEMRKQHNIWIRKPEGKRSLGISVSKWKNIEGISKKSIHTAYNGVRHLHFVLVT
jgi:hypothetical protein